MKEAKPKILIIEDEPDVAHSMQMLLEDSGYKAGFALGGEKGLSLMGKYDLVLLDIMMPGMSGREVLREMAKRGIRKPVIVVSAVGVPEEVRSQLDSIYPGIGFVSKPHIYEFLLGEIRKMLEKK